ncbi:MAG TPA: TolC family protein [Candidatus Hydrogenedentes bacterium]|nr:TolC family protein [Candidatus Hydrogenedentota bacterium]HPG66707.1 TolC family protein [Candidatus Hydrogenedentota bacterium]
MVTLLAGMVLLTSAVLCGCATVGPDTRPAQAQADRDALVQKTAECVPEGRALRLEDCVRIALANNLKVKAAEIDARIAQLQKKTAFANFLPTLDMSWQYVGLDRQPKSQMLGPLAVPVQDRVVREAALDVQMPVFVPATWFLYSIYDHGAEIGTWVEEYTRQMITLQVTMLYFAGLALRESEAALESQLTAAQSLAKEVRAFREEGLVSAWQVDQAEALVIARQNALHEVARSRDEVRAELMAALGLLPTADLELTPETPLVAPEGALESLILEALLNHPKLHIADRVTAVKREQAKIALAEFLPKLVGFSNMAHTSNSFMLYPDTVAMGAAAVLSIFDGFANVNAYTIAREEKRKAAIEREEATLTVMVEVIKAHLRLEAARDDAAIAKKMLDVNRGRYAEIEAQWDEGLVTPSDKLAALADRDNSQVAVVQAAFQEQMSIATLLNVMGSSYAGYEVRKYEEEL